MSKVFLSDLVNLQNETSAVAALNANNALVENAFDNTLSRDGSAPNTMLADLDMNSKRVLNLVDATTNQEPATYKQLTDAIDEIEVGSLGASFITVASNDILPAERVLQAGTALNLLDEGPEGNIIISVSDAELVALAGTVSTANKVPYYTGVGSAATADFTSFARTLVDDADAATARGTLGITIGTNVEAWSTELDALAALATTGQLTRTGSATYATRTLTAPAAGITVTNGSGVSGNPTLVLANDLSALEGLSSTGLAARTTTDTWAQRTITGTSNRTTITNGDGVAGNPTVDISASYVGQSTITTLGTVATGVWNGTKVGLVYGGTNADLSATGGTSQVLKQVTTGAAVTVGQLAASDLSNGTTGSGAVMLTASPTTTGTLTAAAGNFSGTVTFGTGTITGLTNKVTPDASNDYVVIYDNAGTAVKKATVASVGASSGVSSLGAATGAVTLAGGLSIGSNILTDGWTTGDAKLTFKTTADTGWILCNDGTIGDGSSGASTRANADTSALFTLLWTNCSTLGIQDSSGSTTTRGGSAASDYAAHKRLFIPWTLGRSLAGAGAGSGLTSRVLGSNVGAETETPTLAKTFAHAHKTTSAGLNADSTPGGVAEWFAGAGGGPFNPNTDSQGSSSALNIMQPSVFMNVMIKL